MNQLIAHAMNFKELKLEKSKTDKFEDKSNDNNKNEDKSKKEKSEDKSDKNDRKNSNSNSTITFKNSKKNTDKLSISKNCNYCDSFYHNINKCKLKNSTEQSEK